MRTFGELFEGIIKNEGYYANVKGDKGGETYMGIARNLHPQWEGWETIDRYKKARGGLKWNEKIGDPKLTEQVKGFYREHFYERFGIDRIYNGSLQEIILDWCVNSGRWGSRGVQRVLNQNFGFDLIMDGIIGKKTLAAIDACYPEELFDAVKAARIDYYHKIAKNGQNQKFLKGWLNRVNAIVFEG